MSPRSNSILVVAAPIDAHQRQLFFDRPLARLAADGRLTWSAATYDDCPDDTLDGASLLMLVRPRFPGVPDLLDRAAARATPVVVMIDDNWVAAGREYERFSRLFTPGCPDFEVFVAALGRADAVVVYSPVLAEDVRPYARRVVTLSPFVDLDAFPPRGRRDERFVVGYAGSPRWEPAAFMGTAAFLRRHPEHRLLVAAHEMPAELAGVPPEQRTFVPWHWSYQEYTAALAIAAPDVMLAPLDGTRFSASKVPFKLFDSAAVGAAGIFSRVLPYTDVVRDGVTGILVENDPASWESALEMLAGDPALRLGMAIAAGEEVRSRYAIEGVLPELEALFGDLSLARAQ